MKRRICLATQYYDLRPAQEAVSEFIQQNGLEGYEDQLGFTGASAGMGSKGSPTQAVIAVAVEAQQILDELKTKETHYELMEKLYNSDEKY